LAARPRTPSCAQRRPPTPCRIGSGRDVLGRSIGGNVLCAPVTRRQGWPAASFGAEYWAIFWCTRGHRGLLPLVPLQRSARDPLQ
jgi:hypothetical protein